MFPSWTCWSFVADSISHRWGPVNKPMTPDVSIDSFFYIDISCRVFVVLPVPPSIVSTGYHRPRVTHPTTPGLPKTPSRVFDSMLRQRHSLGAAHLPSPPRASGSVRAKLGCDEGGSSSSKLSCAPLIVPCRFRHSAATPPPITCTPHVPKPSAEPTAVPRSWPPTSRAPLGLNH